MVKLDFYNELQELYKKIKIIIKSEDDSYYPIQGK